MYKELWSILNKKEKKKSYFFFLLVFINSILELSIVIIIVPITQILLNQDIRIPFYNDKIFFENIENSTLIILSVSLLLIIFLFKNFFYTYLSYWQLKYCGEIEKRLSSKLLKKYIYRPFVDSLESNSGVLANNVLNEVMHLPGSIRMHLILISETIVFILISTIILIYEPKGSMTVIGICLIMLFVLNYVQKKYMTYFGTKRYLYTGKSNTTLIQSLQNIKDIKLLGRENFFINYFNKNFKEKVNFQVYYDSLSVVPRPISEIILVIAFFGLVLVLHQDSDPLKIILTTSLFLIATFRLLPSTTRITHAYQAIQLRKTVVKALISDLQNTSETEEYLSNNSKNEKIKFNDRIELKNVSFVYPKTNKIIVNNINLEIKKGQMIGIMGPSGSGKTTLMDIVLGLLDPSTGELLIDGTLIKKENIKNYQDLIGYVPQNPGFIDDTIKRNIAFGVSDEELDKDLLEDAILKSNLNEFLSHKKDGLETIMGENGIKLSGGQKQRIAIARALYKNPELIIFDEATSSLDQKNEKEIMNNVSMLKQNKTVLIIAHKSSVLQDCDKIIFLSDGKIALQDKS